MNTRIARRLNDARRNESESPLPSTCRSIVDAHNQACRHGFIELPMLEYIKVEQGDNEVNVAVTPCSGFCSLDELYMIKQAWGASELHVCTAESQMNICLTFKY